MSSDPVDELRLEGQTVFLPVGMPCSGKSTMFKAAASLPGIGENLSLVCPDAIREELHPGYEAGVVRFGDIDNLMIFEKAEDQLYRLIVDGYDVWFDAMNVFSSHRRGRMFEVELAELDPAFSGDPVRFIVIHLDVPFDEILRRNQACRVGLRRPPVERLEEMAGWLREDDPEQPSEVVDVWRLVWDGTWKPAEGFTPGPVCSALIEATNAFASPSGRRRP